jgi:glycosyltransferase involved in cell wall biosynthesis
MPVVGFDAQATQGKQSGLGVFTCSLLSELKNEISDPLSLRVYMSAVSRDCNISTAQRLKWENWTLPRLVRNDRVDILHVPAFAPAWRKPCPLVVTVHDIAGMLFKNQIGRLSSFYWGKWLPFVVKQADRIIADSHHTQKDLMVHLRVGEEKIRVVYPSGHENFSSAIPKTRIDETKKRFGIKDRYFLFVGTLEPRKNLGRILEAFKLFLKTNPEHQLILAGSKEFAHGRYSEILANKYLLDSSSIITPGYLDHDDLNALYCGAEALVFPSLYEGFGIPILEAMASGCPVITSTATSTPEVAGDAAILVDPYSVEDIAQGLQDLGGKDAARDVLRKKGFEQIRKFSWKKAAREVIAVYKELL